VGYISADTNHFDGIWLRDWIYSLPGYRNWRTRCSAGWTASSSMRPAVPVDNEQRFVIGSEKRIAPVVDHRGAQHQCADLTRDVLNLDVKFSAWKEIAQQADVSRPPARRY